jgi:hypothetical protein
VTRWAGVLIIMECTIVEAFIDYATLLLAIRQGDSQAAIGAFRRLMDDIRAQYSAHNHLPQARRTASTWRPLGRPV